MVKLILTVCSLSLSRHALSFALPPSIVTYIRTHTIKNDLGTFVALLLTFWSGNLSGSPLLFAPHAWLVQCLLNRSTVSSSGSVSTNVDTVSKLQQECAEIRFAKLGGLMVGDTSGGIPSIVRPSKPSPDPEAP